MGLCEKISKNIKVTMTDAHLFSFYTPHTAVFKHVPEVIAKSGY